MMDGCKKCGRMMMAPCAAIPAQREYCLEIQLAAANDRANTYLGEMVRLQEAQDCANERAGRMEKALDDRRLSLSIIRDLCMASAWKPSEIVAYINRILEVRDDDA